MHSGCQTYYCIAAAGQAGSVGVLGYRYTRTVYRLSYTTGREYCVNVRSAFGSLDKLTLFYLYLIAIDIYAYVLPDEV